MVERRAHRPRGGRRQPDLVERAFRRIDRLGQPLVLSNEISTVIISWFTMIVDGKEAGRVVGPMSIYRLRQLSSFGRAAFSPRPPPRRTWLPGRERPSCLVRLCAPVGQKRPCCRRLALYSNSPQFSQHAALARRVRALPDPATLGSQGRPSPAATYGGKLNRTSLKHCVTIMQRLLPALLSVWIDHGADEDWGPMCYPPLTPTRGPVPESARPRTPR